MLPTPRARALRIALAAALVAGAAADAHADAITDWNVRAGQAVVEAKLGTPPAVRVMAVVQTAAYEAVNSITRRYPPSASAAAAPNASVDAAIAAANRVALDTLVPSQRAAISAAYDDALAKIPDGPAKTEGVAVGERAAEAVLARRASDAVPAVDAYRPDAAPGTYVPTVVPAATPWSQRTPWLMKSAAQFRPAPPPALASDTWTRDYDEVRTLGARASTKRTPVQTEIGLFWEFSLPPIYDGVVRSVADQPGREITANARLLAATAQAMDDALIAVFDAKYHYRFWRPVTAIRNGDADGNDATERDATWVPLIDAPMHPEYPSAHSILASAVGTVLEAELEGRPTPVLSTTSPTAKGVTRRWNDVGAFVREVADARVFEGIHFRTSTDVGVAMGRRVGELAVAAHLARPD